MNMKELNLILSFKKFTVIFVILWKIIFSVFASKIFEELHQKSKVNVNALLIG